MVNIGHIGAQITPENLKNLNEGLIAIGGPKQAVTAEEMRDLVEHLESHQMRDGTSIDMDLPSGGGSVTLQRLMGSWNVVRIAAPLEFDI
jgi:hypothetical protein